MNKRDLFKGLVGAAVAGPDAMRQTMNSGSGHYPAPPTSPYPYRSLEVEPLQEALDTVLHEARKVMLKKINQQRELLQNQLNNQIYAIKRQKSTSEAYKDYMIAKLERDRNDVFMRAQRLMDAAWGAEANGPSTGQAAESRY